MTTLALFGAVLAATGAMRVVELAVSLRRVRADPGAAVAEPRLFPAMAVLHLALVSAPFAEVVLLDRPFSWSIGAMAAAILAGATALRIWTLASIGRAWNVRVVRPTVIATSGPYRWIRHPNYLVVILEISAIPMLHGAWCSAIALSGLNALVLWRRIRTEEAALSGVPAWVQAMRSKARFIPGVF